MKIVQIIHNPTAGLAKHSKKDLLNKLEDTARVIKYVSTDEEEWKTHYQNRPDAILIAGGDGTIHKLARFLLQNNISVTGIPIHLLPLGTANNIARTLGISTSTEYELLNPKGKIAKFDCGRVSGIPDQDFFLEGVGFGIIPELISEMKKKKLDNEIPSEKLKRALRMLLEIVKKFKAEKAKIKVDGITIKGSFLLVELLNIKYIGPNFKLAPNADPGDGFFELVMIPEDARIALLDHLGKLIEGKPETANIDSFVKIVRVQQIKMKWKGDKVHLDDNLIDDYSGESVKANILPGALEFIKSH